MRPDPSPQYAHCKVFAESMTPCTDFFLFIVWPALGVVLFILAAYALWFHKPK